MRGSGTGPARGSEGGSASLTGAIGEADAVGASGAIAGVIGGGMGLIPGGAGQMVFGVGLAGGVVVAGFAMAFDMAFDMAIVPEFAPTGAGAAGVTAGVAGALDVMATLVPAAFWLAEGKLATAFVGVGDSAALFGSAGAGVGAGGLSVGIAPV